MKLIILFTLAFLIQIAEGQAQEYDRYNPAYGFREQILIYMDSLDAYV